MESRGLFSIDDRRLVRKFLRTGDERFFHLLYHRHTPRLYPLALRLTGSEADAQDAIQDTWIRACQALNRFEWKSALRTWLTGILINRVREMNRSRLRHGQEHLLDDDSEIAIQPSQTTADLAEGIARLPAGYREVLTLHDIEGYTHEEIGKVLEITAGTSKSQLHRARQALRTVLREEAGK